MPNHCTNWLVVEGPRADVAELVTLMKGETAFDFAKILPMPEILVGSRSGSGEETYAIFHGDWEKAFRFLQPPGLNTNGFEGLFFAEVSAQHGQVEQVLRRMAVAVFHPRNRRSRPSRA